MKRKIQIKFYKEFKVCLTSIMLTIILFSSCSKENVKVNGSSNSEIESIIETENIESKENHYMINTDRHKIHIYSCGSGKVHNPKNWVESRETLKVIFDTYKDYDICKVCNAGLKLYRDITDDEERLISKFMPIYEFADLDKGKQKYLLSIFGMSEWYVNHIPTYKKQLQLESKDKYKAQKINQYILQDSEGIEDKYVAISDIGKNVVKDSDKLLKATEEATIYYKDKYGKYVANTDMPYIFIDTNINRYYCDLLNESKDYKIAGDDCTRYIIACLDNMDNNFVTDIEKMTKYKILNVDSTKMTNDVKITYAMHQKGYEIYDSIASDDVYGTSSNLSIVKKIDEDFKLQAGDILCKIGHCQMFLGYVDNDRCKTFGWGQVHNKCSYILNVNLEKIANKGMVIKLAKDEYTRVYRYIGKENQ